MIGNVERLVAEILDAINREGYPADQAEAIVRRAARRAKTADSVVDEAVTYLRTDPKMRDRL